MPWVITVEAYGSRALIAPLRVLLRCLRRGLLLSDMVRSLRWHAGTFPFATAADGFSEFHDRPVCAV